MTWVNFYLFCFLVGFLWTVVALLVGSLHLHLPFLPHGDLHHGGGHVHVGPSHSASTGLHPATDHGTQVSPLNFGTLAAFMAWFGGVGFLVTAYSSMWFVWGLGLSICSGLVGAAIVFWFLAKVLGTREQDLNPVDYEMVGVLGHVSSPIRAGGTGEIVFSQEGTRRTCGARSEDGVAISRGTEVVVTHYENGIAYVQLWDEFSRSPGVDFNGLEEKK
jgi:membrane protein implicated in regulation of membrane protease activity